MDQLVHWMGEGDQARSFTQSSPALPVEQDVLIVEDNEDCGRVLARALRYMGRTCERVTSGQAALDSLAMHKPRLVILDVMMPDMDGVEVLRQIRTNPDTAGVPVVMYSAISEPDFRAYVLGQGANDYWVKTGLQLEELERRLLTIVTGPGLH